MTASRAWRIGPIGRLSLGLAAVLVSLVLLADMWLGVVPGRGETDLRVRRQVAESLAVQVASLIESGDSATLGRTLQQVLARDRQLRAVTVRSRDGSVFLHRGEAQRAGASAASASTAERLQVPILSGREAWGEIDLRYAANEPATLSDWLAQPAVQLLALLAFGGFLLCYAYLRRAMHYLNPSASVPDRVRKAFDSLSEGLLVLDQQSRIVLANRMFRNMHPKADSDLNGQHIEALTWLTGAAAASLGTATPWMRTLQSGLPVSGEPLELVRPDGETTQLLVSSAPIVDDTGRMRACLVTFDNVTVIHRANEELRSTLQQLETSRRHIEQQNEELRRLVSRDSLTGCFNRRAFGEIAAEHFETARREQTDLCCLMVDIDHFKRFNDTYGHAVGDQVIQVVARALAGGLRATDVLSRHGGEEFCIVLPGAAPNVALAIAEELRKDVESNANRAVRGIEVSPITSSFGLVSMNAAARSLDALIDQADQALYRSKQAGRNRVSVWTPPIPASARVEAEPVGC